MNLYMTRWTKRMAAALLAVMMFVIVGCTSSDTPKEALEKAIKNTSEANSYAMHMMFTLEELELTPSADLQQEMGAYSGIIGMLHNSTITMDALYQKDPMRMDVMLELALNGPIELKIKVPLIITDKLAYIKMPEIPLFPLPDSITGKFIMIDLEEAAADSNAGSIDIEQQRQLGKELASILMQNVDEKLYFSEPKDAELPEGMKADRIVQFQVDDSNFKQTVDTIIDKVLPEVVKLLQNNEESMKLLQLDKEKLESFSKELETNSDEWKTKLMSNLKINELVMTGAIKDKFVVHEDVDFNIEMKDEATSEQMKLGFNMDITYSDINKTPKFESEIPTDTITMEQMLQLLQFPTDL